MKCQNCGWTGRMTMDSISPNKDITWGYPTALVWRCPKCRHPHEIKDEVLADAEAVLVEVYRWTEVIEGRLERIDDRVDRMDERG